MSYNYSKLKGKIKEVLDTQEKYAEMLNLSTTSINNKLNNKTPFSQDEIAKSIKLLNIDPLEVQQYFFTQKVEKN